MTSHEGSHIVPLRVNWYVYAALLALTALTVAVAYMHFIFLHVVVALVVATAKAALVMLYFMHLRWASKTVIAMVLTMVTLLAIAIGFTFFDVAYR